MRSIVLVASIAALSLAACSGGSSSSGSGPAPATEGAGDSTVAIGPIPVAAGGEETVCIVVPFGNTEDVVVNSIDVNLAPGSHHLIVYKTNVAPTTTPYACQPFLGIALGTDTPLMLANKLDVSWTFPKGVAQDVPANSYVKIEAHYINASARAIEGKGQVKFHTTPKSAAGSYQPAGFAFWGTTNIDIPPNASASTGMQFQAGMAGTHLVSVSTHQHRLGTGVMAWESATSGEQSTQIAKDLDWSNPSWSLLAPQYDFNGKNGLSYECSWTNTTDQTISFGESALDEMCFVGGYYYPSKGRGLDLCINGHCEDRN
jgi:hypothetical protein